MLTNGTANMRILSNLVDEATATAVCRINPESLATKTQSGEWVRDELLLHMNLPTRIFTGQQHIIKE